MDEKMKQLTAEQYSRDFSFHPVTPDTESRGENALKTALDIRKFEIDLYWKRATYFWTFLTLTLGAYFTVMLSKVDRIDIGLYLKIEDSNQLAQKHEALLLLSCLGLVFSVCWYLVNRASKYWQENWEKHVDLLESSNQGPLYRTVLHNEKMRWWHPLGAFPFSVSKLNQTLSLFISGLFVILLWSTVNRFYYPLSQLRAFPIAVLLLTLFALLILVWRGQTSRKNSGLTAWRREAGITFRESSDKGQNAQSNPNHKGPGSSFAAK
jgi:hypothetical protein